MLKPISAIIKDSIGNIIFRGNVVTGIVATDNGDKSYDVFISESDKAYPKIFTLSRNPDLAVGDKVRILYKNGCKELPIILPPVTMVAGDLIICCFETNKIWRCRGISNEVIDTLTNITTPSGLTVANGNLISANYVDEYISVHDGFSSTILSQFASPGIGISGLAFDGINLISSDWWEKKIYIHDGISASISSSFTSPSTLPRGLTIINGDLISGDGDSYMIYVHNGITASIKSSFNAPTNTRSTYPNPAPNGLTADGTNLISGDNGYYGVEDDMIFIHNGVTGEILSSFNAPTGCLRVNGLAFFK